MLKALPCFPCPHKSACCSWGADLTNHEAIKILEWHGSEYLTKGEMGPRTAIVNGSCVFLVNNGCTIHKKSYYPEVCAGFPNKAGKTDEPYPGDKTICPELKNA